jgi:2'-5' RNA ligase
MMADFQEADSKSVKAWKNWQRRYRHGVFLILPPHEIRQWVNTQRELYDPTSAAICETHISVSQPLLKPISEQDRILLGDSVRSLKPFEIHIGQLKSFLPYPCIWYEIQPVELILKLRSVLHGTGLFNLVDGYIEDFIPHMTITEGRSGPEVNLDLLEQLQPQSPSGSFICSGLSLMVPDKAFHFHQKGYLPLGSML